MCSHSSCFSAPRYTAVDLGALRGGAGVWRGGLRGGGINAAGDVAGQGYSPPGSRPRTAPLLHTGGRWRDLTSPGAGGPSGEAYDVNNTGAVVGAVWDPSAAGDRARPWRPVRWRLLPGADGGATVEELAGPDGAAPVAGQAFAVNDAGLIVGWCAPAFPGGCGAGGERAVFWRDGGAATVLPGLGGACGAAYAVNQAGQIVGMADTADGAGRATLWEDGAARDLGGPPGGHSVALAINDAGSVAGAFFPSGGRGKCRAVLWRDGAMLDLGAPPGAVSAGARGVNSAGDVTGVWRAASGEYHAFLYTGGVMWDLRALLPPGFPAGEFRPESSLRINDAGRFTATVHHGGEDRLFLFFPADAPEPDPGASAAVTGRAP